MVRFSQVTAIRPLSSSLELSTELHLKFRERQCHGMSTHDLTANCCWTVDDEPLCLGFFFFAMVSHAVDTMFSTLSSECHPGENFKQTQTHGRSNYDSHNGSHVCSECQSGSKPARVNGRSNHDPLVCCVLCLLSSCSRLSHVLHVHIHVFTPLDVQKFTDVHVDVTFIAHFLMQKKRSLEHLLSIMSQWFHDFCVS